MSPALSCRGVEAFDTVQGNILSSVTFTCIFEPAGSFEVCVWSMLPCYDCLGVFEHVHKLVQWFLLDEQVPERK